MKALVIYDSLYGNTEKIARTIADTLGAHGEVSILQVGDVKMEQLAGLDLLVVGSPTQQFKPTAAIKDFLKRIPANALKGLKVAAFDTRLTQSNIDGTPVLPFFVKIFGFAGEPIAKELKKKGGELIAPPEGFHVGGMEGPLKDGELERASDWAGKLLV